ncbi:MAG: hypothetical protein ACREVA_12575, partial [Burkholderiales bacterium]
RASILEADIASWVPGPDPVTTFELADLLVVGNYADCEFFCFSNGVVEPRQFKVLGITETEIGHYTIKALEVPQNKYLIIESDLELPPFPSNTLFQNVLPAVTNLEAIYNAINLGGNSRIDLRISWNWSGSLEFGTIFFNLVYKFESGEKVKIPAIVEREYTVKNIAKGNYTIKVVAENLLGKRSRPTILNLNRTTVIGDSTLLPPINVRNPIPVFQYTDFDTRDLTMLWDYNPANDNVPDKLYNYRIVIRSAADDAKLNTFWVFPDEDDRGGKFNYTVEQNTIDHGGIPSRNIKVSIKSFDVEGDKSIRVLTDFTNFLPSQTFFLPHVTANKDRSIYTIFIRLHTVDTGQLPPLDLKGFIIVFVPGGNLANVTTKHIIGRIDSTGSCKIDIPIQPIINLGGLLE